MLFDRVSRLTTSSAAIRGFDVPAAVTFPATVLVLGSGEVRLDTEIRVNRADFGLTWNQMGMASMKNTITVHAVFGKLRPA